MLPTTPFTGPDKRPVFQPNWIFVYGNPGLGRLVNDVSRVTVARVGEIHVEKRLFAILRLVDHVLVIGRPRHTRNEQIRGLILERVYPAHLTAGSAYNTEFHDWIRIAGFGIRRDLNVLVVRNVIDDRELRHRRLVETKKGDGG